MHKGESKMAENMNVKGQMYYKNLLDLIVTVGRYASSYKLYANAERGIYPCQVVQRETFGNDGNLDFETKKRLSEVKRAIKDFDYWSQGAGFKPLSEKDKKNVLNFLFKNAENRSKLKYRVERNIEECYSESIRDLIIEVKLSQGVWQEEVPDSLQAILDEIQLRKKQKTSRTMKARKSAS